MLAEGGEGWGMIHYVRTSQSVGNRISGLTGRAGTGWRVGLMTDLTPPAAKFQQRQLKRQFCLTGEGDNNCVHLKHRIRLNLEGRHTQAADKLVSRVKAHRAEQAWRSWRKRASEGDIMQNGTLGRSANERG